MKKQYISESFKHFLHGGDYNPEQWIDTKEIWDEDMRLMKLAHCNQFSVGIFSWSVLEPREGEYDFSFLDEILDKIYAAGGRVFLATPSGARPHWLAEKYPEVLRVGENGLRNPFTARHNHSCKGKGSKRTSRTV
jgi:beta-galactosidase